MSRDDIVEVVEVCSAVIVRDIHETELCYVLDTSEPVPVNDTDHILLVTPFLDLHYCIRSSDPRHVRGVVVDKYIAEPLCPLDDALLVDLQRSPHFLHESKLVGEEMKIFLRSPRNPSKKVPFRYPTL
ncbi:hypothetical protein Aduo_001722 [Ancylostoma duodenale]